MSEPPRPEVCVGAVVVVDDRLLMVRRGRPPDAGRWSVPGGRVEPGETVRDAVVRELEEETGLEGVCDRFVGWVERVGDDHHFVILDFTVTVLPGDAAPGDDASDVGWFPVDDVGAWPPVVDGLVDFLADHGVVAVL